MVDHHNILLWRRNFEDCISFHYLFYFGKGLLAMKKIVAIILSVGIIISLTGCGVVQSQAFTAKTYNASELIDVLKSKGLPISDRLVFTASTDYNKLLGRPNQYISKADFADNRYQQNDPEYLVGGTIETFNNSSDLQRRVSYLNGIGEDYETVNGNYLLRIRNYLTPDQAKEYENAFKSIK